jgi:D-alanyl-lipoteichoic acid acyltransferase DltB (MBOAT superfamily)
MLFNSLEFLIFLPIAFLLFDKVKNKKMLLLVLSYLFYMYWNPIYIVLILFSTIVDFKVAGLIENASYTFIRRIWLGTSISLNLGLLFVFKYFNFFLDTIGNSHLMLQLILPVGISFYTFQTMGYSIDVYYKRLKAERNLLNFSLFVCYFPQLVAGPIEKASILIPSLSSLNKKHLVFDSVVFQKIFIGLFKKVVIADRLAIYINHIYESPVVSSLDIILVFYLFSIQIYCDFSGYCDIAIGVSRAFGVKLTENFLQPYFSMSIREFWTRWHVTLSFWFRDYLYIPLGGKHGFFKGSLNLFVVFLVSGLWHGANWTFVVWGGIHGGLLLIEKKFDPLSKLPMLLKILITFHLVCLSWIFFRANDISQAFQMINNFFEFNFSEVHLGGSMVDLCFGLFCYLLLLVYDSYLFRNGQSYYALKIPCFSTCWVRFLGASFLVVFGVFSQTEFLYFQF